MDLREDHLLGSSIAGHWYYRAKLAAVSELIGKRRNLRVLDIGAGSGFFSRALIERGLAARAVCVDPGYPGDRDEKGGKLSYCRTVADSDADLVLMMDVIEHLDDDIGLVRNYAAKVASGTTFIVTVPAFAWLWSGHDVFLGHRRRYTRAAILSVLTAAGLKVDRSCYYFAAALPIAAVARFASKLHGRRREPASDLRAHGPLVNAALFAICRAEIYAMRLNWLGGITVLVRAIKA